MKKLILFDIDGTLIHCGKAPRRAITEAMRAVFGTTGNVDSYPFSGKTDTQIIYDVITGAAVSEVIVRDKMQETIDGYVTRLHATLEPNDVKTLDGITVLLNHLLEQEHAILGLLTGNVAKGAEINLTRAGLHPYFFNGKGAIGAFGSDSMNRNELPAIAVKRAYERTGRLFKEKDIVIIGDSPYDIICAKGVNARSIAVATGWHTPVELREYEPDYLFDNFSATHDVVNAIFK